MMSLCIESDLSSLNKYSDNSLVCMIKAMPIIEKSMITSATRSATMVPKAFWNGIPSYFEMAAARATSPDRGIAKLSK